MQKVVWLVVGVLVGVAIASRRGRQMFSDPEGLPARIESVAREFTATVQKSYRERQDELRSALGGGDRP